MDIRELNPSVTSEVFSNCFMDLKENGMTSVLWDSSASG
jgi:hypothetical protein